VGEEKAVTFYRFKLGGGTLQGATPHRAYVTGTEHPLQTLAAGAEVCYLLRACFRACEDPYGIDATPCHHPHLPGNPRPTRPSRRQQFTLAPAL